MEEIHEKILELWNLLQNIPPECKGDSIEATKNRRAYMHVRYVIHQLV